MTRGLHVKLPDRCRCASDVAIIGKGNALTCRGCRRKRGVLNAFTANWIAQVVAVFDRPADPIVLRSNCQPRPSVRTRKAPLFTLAPEKD
jgi:hypothetical protein